MSAEVTLRKTQTCADEGCGKTLSRGVLVRQFGGSFYCLEGHDEHRDPEGAADELRRRQQDNNEENAMWPPVDRPTEPEAIKIVRMFRDALTEMLGRGGWE